MKSKLNLFFFIYRFSDRIFIQCTSNYLDGKVINKCKMFSYPKTCPINLHPFDMMICRDNRAYA